MQPSRFLSLGTLAGLVLAAAPATGAPRVELPSGVPELKVMRTATVLVRIVNDTPAAIPGCSALDYERGNLCVFLGAWYADERPRTLGTFQHTLRLERTIPSGSADFASIEVKPDRAGRVFLGVGLYLGSRSNVGSGQFGHIAATHVYVAHGSWLDGHRRLLLRALVGLHLGGTLLAAGLLLGSARRR